MRVMLLVVSQGSQVKDEDVAARKAQAEEAGGSEASSIQNSPANVSSSDPLPEPRRRVVGQPVPDHSSNLYQSQEQQQVAPEMVNLESSGPWLSTYVVIVLMVAIAFLVFRRLFLME